MTWDPATGESWCGPCAAMRAPDGCPHRIAAARARERGHTGHIGHVHVDARRPRRRWSGEWVGEVAETVAEATVGALWRGVVALCRAFTD